MLIRGFAVLLGLWWLFWTAPFLQAATDPSLLQLHPSNPRYFLWRGKPTVLITSAEHYGAVLNRRFDFRRYLTALNRDGLNYTRIFTGAYVEPEGAFSIARNTLAPTGEDFIAPWARGDMPGYAGGGNKFDLHRWDEAYFTRLKAFIKEADRRGVVVEVTLFCPMYEDKQWHLSPMRAANNVQGAGTVARTQVYTLDQHGGLLLVQEALVRKLVAELRDFGNIIYEICNEPYFGGVTLEWQRHIADLIHELQRDHRRPKLIAQNIANGTATIAGTHPAVSVFNFHYASPPSAISDNAKVRGAFGDDETGFRGTGDAVYRMEGWEFMIAGGALFNHLDYSFAVGDEAGTFAYPPTQPGGGGKTFRRQMSHLARFMNQLDFTRMSPDPSTLRSAFPEGVSGRVLSLRGEDYAVYLRTGSTPAQFSARWTGSLTAPRAGEYMLHTLSNDGVRVWLDGRLVIDNWTEHSTAEDKAAVRLEAGRAHALKVEYFYAGGDATMKLLWSGEGMARTAVPAGAFRTQSGQPGLEKELFADKTLSARTSLQVVSGIEIAGPRVRDGGSEIAPGSLSLDLDLPPGSYEVRWFDTKTGAWSRREKVRHGGGVCSFRSPGFTDDVAARIRRL